MNAVPKAGLQAAPADRATIDTLLAALLRQEEVRWPPHWGTKDGKLFVDRVIYHGVAALILGTNRYFGAFPEFVRDPLARHARVVAMRELRHRDLLVEALDSFAKEGIDAILLKGGALAYDLYPNAGWRERGDSDILVKPVDRDRANRVLAGLGYDRSVGEGMAEECTLQHLWTRSLDDGTEHDIDLHIAPINVPAFADRITFREAAMDRHALTALGPNAFAPALDFMLFHACLHRRTSEDAPYRIGTTNHYGNDRLIWLKDIDLLARAMTEADWRRFVELARSVGEERSCHSGLTAAMVTLATPVRGSVLSQLDSRGSLAKPYLDSGPFRRAVLDIRSMGSGRRRAKYVLNRLFPTADFLRAKYRETRLPLPLLYARRLVDYVRPRRSANAR